MKPKDITYCHKCKKYFDGILDNDNCFPICPNCNGMSIVRIIYEENKSFFIEEPDENIFGFYNYRSYKSMRKVFDNLIKKSRGD